MEVYGGGRVLIGAGTENDGTEEKTFAINSEGGKYNHTLTIDEMPRHSHRVYLNHSQNIIGGTTIPTTSAYFDHSKYANYCSYKSGNPILNKHQWIFGNTDLVGEFSEHNNIQPYITVYMYKRVS